MYLISKTDIDDYTLYLEFNFYKNQKKNIELSAIFDIFFVEILVKFNNASNISNVIHKTKIKLRCFCFAPNQPKRQVWFQTFVKYSLIYLISQTFQ